LGKLQEGAGNPPASFYPDRGIDMTEAKKPMVVISCALSYNGQSYDGVDVCDGVQIEQVDTCIEGKKAIVFPNAKQKGIPSLLVCSSAGESLVRNPRHLKVTPEVVA
jgi:hypothetical protein